MTNGTPITATMPEVALEDALSAALREGARRMLISIQEAEVQDYISRFADERDEAGRRLVVRNGHCQPR